MTPNVTSRISDVTPPPTVDWLTFRRQAALLPLRPHPSYFLSQHRHPRRHHSPPPSSSSAGRAMESRQRGLQHCRPCSVSVSARGHADYRPKLARFHSVTGLDKHTQIYSQNSTRFAVRSYLVNEYAESYSQKSSRILANNSGMEEENVEMFSRNETGSDSAFDCDTEDVENYQWSKSRHGAACDIGDEHNGKSRLTCDFGESSRLHIRSRSGCDLSESSRLYVRSHAMCDCFKSSRQFGVPDSRPGGRLNSEPRNRLGPEHHRVSPACCDVDKENNDPNPIRYGCELHASQQTKHSVALHRTHYSSYHFCSDSRTQNFENHRHCHSNSSSLSEPSKKRELTFHTNRISAVSGPCPYYTTTPRTNGVIDRIYSNVSPVVTTATGTYSLNARSDMTTTGKIRDSTLVITTTSPAHDKHMSLSASSIVVHEAHTDGSPSSGNYVSGKTSSKSKIKVVTNQSSWLKPAKLTERVAPRTFWKHFDWKMDPANLQQRLEKTTCKTTETPGNPSTQSPQSPHAPAPDGGVPSNTTANQGHTQRPATPSAAHSHRQHDTMADSRAERPATPGGPGSQHSHAVVTADSTSSDPKTAQRPGTLPLASTSKGSPRKRRHSLTKRQKAADAKRKKTTDKSRTRVQVVNPNPALDPRSEAAVCTSNFDARTETGVHTSHFEAKIATAVTSEKSGESRRSSRGGGLSHSSRQGQAAVLADSYAVAQMMLNTSFQDRHVQRPPPSQLLSNRYPGGFNPFASEGLLVTAKRQPVRPTPRYLCMQNVRDRSTCTHHHGQTTPSELKNEPEVRRCETERQRPETERQRPKSERDTHSVKTEPQQSELNPLPPAGEADHSAELHSQSPTKEETNPPEFKAQLPAKKKNKPSDLKSRSPAKEENHPPELKSQSPAKEENRTPQLKSLSHAREGNHPPELKSLLPAKEENHPSDLKSQSTAKEQNHPPDLKSQSTATEENYPPDLRSQSPAKEVNHPLQLNLQPLAKEKNQSED